MSAALMRSLATMIGVAVLLASGQSYAQDRFDLQTYRDWAAAANGLPCETQLDGFYSGSRAIDGLYPSAALVSQTSGDVLLTFDTRYVDGLLSVENARVFASSPPGIFDDAALAIAHDFRFPPEMRNCQGLRAILSFRVNDANADRIMRGFIVPAYANPPLRADTTRALREGSLRDHCGIEDGAINKEEFGIALAALYPERASVRGHDGWAVVQYTIAPDGSVQGPTVLEESQGGFEFGAAALQAILVARYPRRETACVNAASTVRFVLR